VAERPWGFNSPLSHQQSISIIQTRVSLSTSLLPLILAAIRSSRAHEIVRLGAVPIPYYLEVKNFLEKVAMRLCSHQRGKTLTKLPQSSI
jgi:hypothetical protein